MKHRKPSASALLYTLLAFSLCIGCSSNPRLPALDNQWDDPIASTFEHCGDLFTATDNHRECAFSDRRERGYDVVEDEAVYPARRGAGPGGRVDQESRPPSSFAVTTMMTTSPEI